MLLIAREPSSSAAFARATGVIRGGRGGGGAGAVAGAGGALAERLNQQFIEVLLAPRFEDGALEVLTRKESLRILEAPEFGFDDERELARRRFDEGLMFVDRRDYARALAAVVERAAAVRDAAAGVDDKVPDA